MTDRVRRAAGQPLAVENLYDLGGHPHRIAYRVALAQVVKLPQEGIESFTLVPAHNVQTQRLTAQ